MRLTLYMFQIAILYEKPKPPN